MIKKTPAILCNSSAEKMHVSTFWSFIHHLPNHKFFFIFHDLQQHCVYDFSFLRVRISTTASESIETMFVYLKWSWHKFRPKIANSRYKLARVVNVDIIIAFFMSTIFGCQAHSRLPVGTLIHPSGCFFLLIAIIFRGAHAVHHKHCIFDNIDNW